MSPTYDALAHVRVLADDGDHPVVGALGDHGYDVHPIGTDPGLLAVALQVDSDDPPSAQLEAHDRVDAALRAAGVPEEAAVVEDVTVRSST